ncbi:MAG: hypothetical protein MI867_11360, partial [Pseudomonadales bacterium]|nr:hypothetical protein [Pseudomonadales bacterium]
MFHLARKHSPSEKASCHCRHYTLLRVYYLNAVASLSGSPALFFDLNIIGNLQNLLSASIPFFDIEMPTGEQLLTSQANERKNAKAEVGATYNGIEGGIFNYQVPDSVPLYRFRHNGVPSNSIYTSSESERATLTSGESYTYEGITGYVLTADTLYKGMPVKPLYRLSTNEGTKHHFTSSQSLRDTLISQGWQSEGISGYLTSSPWVAMDNNDYSLFKNTVGQQLISMSRLNKIH